VEPLPRHVAAIMDGNGRWAKRRGFLRLRGHEQGANSLRRITRYCARVGVEELTIYALSTENYLRRPGPEVQFLMKLLKDYLTGERQELADGNIRLRSIGRTWEFPDHIQRELEITSNGSAGHTGMTLRLALNYGGRSEIVDGLRRLAARIEAGEEDIGALRDLDEDGFRQYLYDADMSDPDLVIRTGGDTRLSNFLLWQASYAEIWITDVLWPDFNVDDLNQAFEFFSTRPRKFGAVEPQRSPSTAASPIPDRPRT
jgi:undecaprenyl diphosphate synthase